MIIDEIITVGNSQWKIVQAISKEAAEDEIAMARCTGSIGGTRTEERNGVKTIIASVVRLNSDGTETQPYAGY